MDARKSLGDAIRRCNRIARRSDLAELTLARRLVRLWMAQARRWRLLTGSMNVFETYKHA